MPITTPIVRQAKSLPDPAQQFASVAANLPGIVYRRVLAADGSITYPYVSRGIRTLLGYEADEAVRNPMLLRSTISEKDRARFAEAIRRSAEELSSFDLELRSVTAAGEEIWVRSIAQTEAGPDGSIVWDGV